MGLFPDAESVKPFGFKQPTCPAKTAIAGLSWLMSLNNGFSVFAFDQLDCIVKRHYVPAADADSEEYQTAKRIIPGICDGLSAHGASLRD